MRPDPHPAGSVRSEPLGCLSATADRRRHVARESEWRQSLEHDDVEEAIIDDRVGRELDPEARVRRVRDREGERAGPPDVVVEVELDPGPAPPQHEAEEPDDGAEASLVDGVGVREYLGTQADGDLLD